MQAQRLCDLSSSPHAQETKARLQRQAANLRKADEDSRAALARSEAARSEQERRLEAACSQVSALSWMSHCHIGGLLAALPENNEELGS